jgi:small GTP-binding protein
LKKTVGKLTLTDKVWVLKICSAGAYNVGKTSLIRRYAENTFKENYLPTIGVDVTTKHIILDRSPFIGQKVKLLLMDTAGQEYFNKIRKTYYVGAFSCIICYDITQPESFEVLDRWIEDFRSVAGNRTFLTLVGNKNDLKYARSVSYNEGRSFADQYGIPFNECSAKLGSDVIPLIYEEIVYEYLVFIKEKELIWLQNT